MNPQIETNILRSMADWRERAHLNGDVVFFEYIQSELAKDAMSVFVWDIDKTYLDTHFETLKGLYRTILEKAFQKRNVPGTGSLVRALTAKEDSQFPIYFVTASPPQMEEKIKEKLELDGIKPYGIFCKDNLKNLKPGRLRRLTQQVGFKVQALMQLRSSLNSNVKQILWGDDSESDAVIYSLYSDICSRRLTTKSIRQILSHFNVRGEQTDIILALQEKVAENDPVEKIYINLATDTDPEYYHKFGRRTLATYNSFQIALDLFQEKHIGLEQIISVAQDMIVNYAFTPEEIAKGLDDFIRRNRICIEYADKVAEELKSTGLIPDYYSYSKEPIRLEQIKNMKSQFWDMDEVRWVPQYIDYFHDFR